MCINWNNKESVNKANQALNKMGQPNLGDIEVQILTTNPRSIMTVVSEDRFNAIKRLYNIDKKTQGNLDLFINYNPTLTFEEAIVEFKNKYKIQPSYSNITTVNKLLEDARNKSKYDAIRFGVDGSDGKFVITYNRKEDSFNQLSKESRELPDEKLIDNLKIFLNKIGVEYKSVSQIFDDKGQEIDAIAKASIIRGGLHKMIEIVESKADVTTLPEETAHIVVTMMRGNKLYQTMMEDVVMYPEYDEVKREYSELYNNDETKIREEAIGKLIAQRVVEQNKQGITEPRFNRVQRWWNEIVAWFKSKLGIIDNDPYTQAAKKILFYDLQDLKLGRIESISFYQLGQTNIVDKLEREADKITLQESTHKYFYEGKEVKESVTEFRDRENKSYVNKRDISAEEEARNEILRTWGVKGHADFQNIITRLIEEREGKNTTARVHNLPIQYYEALEKYCQDLLSSFPVGTIFKSEIKIIDPKANKGEGRAGTIDFLAIEPDGKTNILDWKFIEFSEKSLIDGEVPFFKKKDFDTQLTEYKRILKSNYGINNFGLTRVIPIRMVYKTYDPITERKGKFLSSLEIGDLKINKEKLYLNPLPIEDERTGNKTVDNIIDGLVQQRNDILSSTGLTASQKVIRKRRLDRINAAIKELQINQTLDKFFEDADYELRLFNKYKDLSDEQLINGEKLINFYKTIDFSYFLDDAENIKEFKDKVSGFVPNLNRISNNIKDEIKNRLIRKAYEEWKIDDITEPQIDITKLGKNWRSFSQQNHPKIKALFKIVTKSKDKVIESVDELNKKINSSVTKIAELGKQKGLKPNDYFDFMIDTLGNGTLTLVRPYDKNIFSAIKAAKQSKNYDALYGKPNSFYEWNEEKYNQDLEEDKKYWIELYKNDVDRVNKVKQRVTAFTEKYNPKVSKKAILITSSKYFTLKDNPDFYSKKYKEIIKNPVLKEFYDLFTNFLEESKEWLDKDLSDNFLPQVLKSTVETLGTEGLNSIKGLKESFMKSLEARETGDGVAVTNKLTGEIELKVPIYYNYNLEENASKDLGKVLSLWSMMAYNHKYMSEIKTSADLLLNAFKDEKIIKVDLLGKPIVGADGKYEEVVGKSNNLEAFIEFMNDSIYGVRTEKGDFNWSKTVKDDEGNEKEVVYSGRKVLNKAIKYFTQKTLFGNFISGAANLVGTMSNTVIEGAGERFYNKKDFVKSINRLKSGFLDKKNTVMIRYFDIMDDMEGFNKADALSVRAAERFFTPDKWYFLQKKGDTLTLNTILGAMLNSHGMDSNGNIKHLRELPEGTKSLYDSAEIVNDKVVIKGLTDATDTTEYRKFRRKVLEVGKTIIGNAPTYDARLINNTIYGQLLMTFRNWIPRMVDTRFGDLRYNESLEDFELGRYRSFSNFLFNKQLPLRVLELLKGFGIYGFGLGINIDEHCKILYEKLPEHQKEKVSLEKFTALHKANLQSTMMELQMMLTFASLLLLAKPDDDEEETTKTKYLLKIIDRSLNELSFFISPKSFDEIIKSPVPVFGLASDLINLVTNTGGELTGVVIGNEDMTNRNKPTKFLYRSFPITSEAVRNIQILDKDYFNK